ncbi:MAG: hypothetical protein JHC30_05480 [Caldisericum sp.]|jgi:hypothetical protein|nr:hypothetical protein [Caldisericum sp.]
MNDVQIIEEKKEIASADKIVQVAKQVLKPSDFATIKTKVGNIIEIKRDGILNLLSSLPISYNFRLVEREITEDYALVRVELEVIFPNGVVRRGEGVGVCERAELKGIDNLHNLLTKAETRAMKRATEVCLGAVINTVIKELFDKQPTKTIEEVMK